MTKNAKRRDQFRKLGQALSQIKAERNQVFKDYATFDPDQQFDIKPATCQNPELETGLNRQYNGPHLKTQQWIRTVRSS